MNEANDLQSWQNVAKLAASAVGAMMDVDVNDTIPTFAPVKNCLVAYTRFDILVVVASAHAAITHSMFDLDLYLLTFKT